MERLSYCSTCGDNTSWTKISSTVEDGDMKSARWACKSCGKTMVFRDHRGNVPMKVVKEPEESTTVRDAIEKVKKRSVPRA